MMAVEESLWQAGTRGGGLSGHAFYPRFRRYLTNADLEPSGVHITRHAAARLRRDAGESVEAASAFLDHSSLAVTTVYLRRLENPGDATWALVADAIGAS
jgi:integrase